MTPLPAVVLEESVSIPENLRGFHGAGVPVAIIDSGWARDVTDERVMAGVGLVDPEEEFAVRQTNDDDDLLGHGTACADLVLRLAPQATIVPVRVFGHRLETSTAILVAALEWVTATGVRVANLSLGTLRPDALQPLYAACERARRNGVIIVAAHRPGYPRTLPAAFDNVLGVAGAPGPESRVLQYRPDEAVEIWAPARHTAVRCGPGRTNTVRGNSFAAPIATGLVARLVERAPDITIDGVRAFLRRGVEAGASTEHPV